MWSSAPTGDIAAEDFTGDGKADVASIWDSGLWYQDGATLDWFKVTGIAPRTVTAGHVTGRGSRCAVDTDCSDGVDCTMDTCVDGVCVFWEDFCDLDGDGLSPAEGDCDDNDPNVFPGAAEMCGDGIDQDCDNVVDEGCVSDWTCSTIHYDTNDGCDCGCGAYDPDCDDPHQVLYGCPEGQLCSTDGVCIIAGGAG
ncbi:putative metal-binding motif-containing protein [Myxococcota bacterium]